jgi:hypothetical protein
MVCVGNVAKRRKSSEEAWSVLEMLQREERAVERHGLCWKCCKEKKEQWRGMVCVGNVAK